MKMKTGRGLAALLIGSTAIVAPALTASGLAMALSALTASSASAQDYTSGILTGTVRDEGGAPVSGATVLVTSAQGAKRSTTTGADGTFNVPALPFGDYTATVSAEGLATLKEPVSVGASGSTYTLTLGKVGEVAGVVVTARRALKTADFNRTDVGLTVDVGKLTSEVPVARNITSIALLTPGAGIPDPTIVANGVRRTNQSVVTLVGTSAAENAYYINGLNVTDQRNFLGYANIPFDAILSEDIKTDGYQAEYGRATGGVLSITTKSGTNDLHFGASVFYSPDSLRDHSPNAASVGPGSGGTTYNSQTHKNEVESDEWISLPLLKDHLFFFGIYDTDFVKTSAAATGNGAPGTVAAQTGSQAFTYSHTPSWLFKLDAAITDKQRVEWTQFSDINVNHNASCTWSTSAGCTTAGSPYDNHSGGINNIVKYTGVFTDWFTLSALYGQNNSNFTDSGAVIGTPMVRDQRSGSIVYLTSNLGSAGPFQQADADSRDTYRIDGDFYFHLFGSHHLRIGADDERLKSTDFSGYAGGGAYWDIKNTVTNSAPIPGSAYVGDYVRETYYASGGAFHATQNAYYVQDSWQPIKTLTIQVGVRNDTYDYRTGGNQSFIKVDDQYAPRVGVTWDPIGEGNDKIYGSYGRYYLPIAENTAIREAAAAPYFREYFMPVEVAGVVQQNANGTPQTGAQVGSIQVFSASTAPDAKTVAAKNIEPMYSEDFVIGYEHIFREGRFADWRAGIKYIHRNLANTIEDTSLQNTDGSNTSYGDGVVGRYCNRVGISMANCNENAYTGVFTLINPGKPMTVWLDVDGTGAKYVNLTTADFGLPKATDTYDAVTLSLEKPFNGVWGVKGSYVWSRNYGNYEGAVASDIGQTDTSITQEFDTPYQENNATGYLPNDRTHTFKIFGTYSPIPDFVIGVNQLIQSGRPYGCIGYDPGDPNPSPTPSEWSCVPPGAPIVNSAANNVPSPRGSRGRTQWLTNTDLMIAYKKELPEHKGTITAEFDVFNLFGQHAITRIVEQGDVSGSYGTPLSTYGLPRTYQDPRYVRFGLRYAY